jgi:GNAT superfamily N-acetyltransferase
MLDITDKLITPVDGLRLPDAITVKFGPAELLTRFILTVDKEVRDKGLKLRLRHNFNDLMALNEAERSRGKWFKLVYMFDPAVSDLTPDNAFWISAENDAGEIVACQAVRIYHWPTSTLADEARLMFYGGVEKGQQCIVTAKGAFDTRGWVYYGGALWVRPDYRGIGLSAIMPRACRAYAATRWPIDWTISFVAQVQLDKGIVAGYGYTDVSYSIRFPDSDWGDLDVALIRMSSTDLITDLASYLGAKDAERAARPRSEGGSAETVAA